MKTNDVVRTGDPALGHGGSVISLLVGLSWKEGCVSDKQATVEHFACKLSGCKVWQLGCGICVNTFAAVSK